MVLRCCIDDEDDTHIYETFSQEFQWYRVQDSNAQWILGAFYYNERFEVFQQLELNDFLIYTGL